MKKIPKLFKKLTALTMAICMSVMGTSVVGGGINEVKAYHPTQESEIAKAKRSYRNAARENGYSITIKYKIIVGDDFVTVAPTIDKKKYTRNGKSNKWACQNIDYQAGLVKYFYNGYFDDQRNSAGIYVENFFELEKSKRQTEEPPIISYGGEQLSNRTFISTGCAVSAIGRTEEEETVKVHIRPMEDFLYNIPYLLVATEGDKNTLYLRLFRDNCG